MGVQVAAIKGRTERERNADSYTIAIESLPKDRNNSSGNRTIIYEHRIKEAGTA